MSDIRTPQLLASEPVLQSFKPFAAIFSVRGPVDTAERSILSRTITCVSSYTSTQDGKDSDMDIDADY